MGFELMFYFFITFFPLFLLIRYLRNKYGMYMPMPYDQATPGLTSDYLEKNLKEPRKE